MAQQRKQTKVVSKAQYRLFRDDLARLERGQRPIAKNMSVDDLREALADVDYDALPERATAQRQTPPTTYADTRAAILAARTPVAARVQTQEAARAPSTLPVVSLDAYGAAHPGYVVHRLLLVRKAAVGSYLFRMEPSGPQHWLLRDTDAVKAITKAMPGVPRAHVWSLEQAQAFLAALGTDVPTMEATAKALAYRSSEGRTLRRGPVKPLREEDLPEYLRQGKKGK